MNADDFKTGDQVMSDLGKDGVVIEAKAKCLQYPGFVPVQWEDGERTMILPDLLVLLESSSNTTHEVPVPADEKLSQANRDILDYREKTGYISGSGGWFKVDDGGHQSSPGFGDHVVLVQLDASVELEVSLERLDGGLKIRVAQVGVAEDSVSLRRKNNAGSLSTGAVVDGGSEKHRASVAQPLSDDSFQRGDDQIIGHEPVLSPLVVENDPASHDSSPSVGAPHRAVCDNPEPTEGETAGTFNPLDVPAQAIESLHRVEGLLGDIKDLLTAQAGGKTFRIVQKGDVLGYAGSTGNSSEDHSHFERGRRK